MEFKELIGKTLKTVAFENGIIELIDIDDNVYGIRVINPNTSELKVNNVADINNILMSPITTAYDILDDDCDYDGGYTYRHHYFVIITKKGGYTFNFFDYSKELCKFGKVISKQNLNHYYRQEPTR